MAVDTAEFRRVMGHWVTGVSVVAAQASNGLPCGLTLNAFCSVSLEPPLVLVSVDKSADSHKCISEAGAFSVNVLASDQERLARRFADWATDEKFVGVAFRSEQTGSPILEEALAWVDCRIWTTCDAGDHTLFIGEVLAADAREGMPLLYYRGGYGRYMP